VLKLSGFSTATGSADYLVRKDVYAAPSSPPTRSHSYPFSAASAMNDRLQIPRRWFKFGVGLGDTSAKSNSGRDEPV